MQKITGLQASDGFHSRIYGGSTPKFFYTRVVGKSPSLLRPIITMDYLIPNEVICYDLANLIVGINVPEHFLGKYEGEPYFFTRDIDPRADHEVGPYEVYGEQLGALDGDEVCLASAFNLWILNRDAADGRNMIIVDGKLYQVDFGNALFGTRKGEWQNYFEYFKDNKEHSQTILFPWAKLDLNKFNMFLEACKVIASIPDSSIEFVLKKALRSELIDVDEYKGARDFLIERKAKLEEAI